jgi:hypothetical protein
MIDFELILNFVKFLIKNRGEFVKFFIFESFHVFTIKSSINCEKAYAVQYHLLLSYFIRDNILFSLYNFLNNNLCLNLLKFFALYFLIFINGLNKINIRL